MRKLKLSEIERLFQASDRLWFKPAESGSRAKLVGTVPHCWFWCYSEVFYQKRVETNLESNKIRKFWVNQSETGWMLCFVSARLLRAFNRHTIVLCESSTGNNYAVLSKHLCSVNTLVMEHFGKSPLGWTQAKLWLIGAIWQRGLPRVTEICSPASAVLDYGGGGALLCLQILGHWWLQSKLSRNLEVEHKWWELRSK
jgi:hypothetical protein